MTDREKLIELIGEMQIHGYMERRDATGVWVWYPPNDRLADHLLNNGVTFATDTKVGDKWTPTAERLPFAEYGESDDVLAITELGVMRTLYFDGGNWCFQNGECCPHKVTHWMPLPEPPKEE